MANKMNYSLQENNNERKVVDFIITKWKPQIIVILPNY